MTPQEAKQRLERIWKDYTSAYDTASIEDLMAFDMANNALGAIEQIQWERDLAIKQLHDLGYGLGEKPREDNSSSDKLIKASDAVDIVAKHSALYGNGEITTDEGEALLYDIMSEIMNLPSAQSEPVTNCHDLTAAIEAIERIFDRCEEIEAHLPEGDPDRVGYKMYPDWLTVWKYLHQVPSAQPDAEYISQQAVTESDLIDWYINSVDESEPVWTEEHIYELFNDFYLIPKENR